MLWRKIDIDELERCGDMYFDFQKTDNELFDKLPGMRILYVNVAGTPNGWLRGLLRG